MNIAFLVSLLGGTGGALLQTKVYKKEHKLHYHRGKSKLTNGFPCMGHNVKI